MWDSPVDSVRLLCVVGFCMKSARKSSSLHSKCNRCATRQMDYVTSRKARTGRIKCHGRTGCSVDSVKEKPDVQEEPVPIKSSNVWTFRLNLRIVLWDKQPRTAARYTSSCVNILAWFGRAWIGCSFLKDRLWIKKLVSTFCVIIIATKNVKDNIFYDWRCTLSTQSYKIFIFTFNPRLNATSNNTPSRFAVIMATNINKYRAGDTQKPDNPD